MRPCVETAIVTASDAAAGAWVFDMRGKGLEPTVMDTVELYATMGQSGSSMVAFANPFRDAVNVKVTLETEEADGVFALMLNRTRGHTARPKLSPVLDPHAFAARADLGGPGLGRCDLVPCPAQPDTQSARRPRPLLPPKRWSDADQAVSLAVPPGH